jgi:hypothetical protein
MRGVAVRSAGGGTFHELTQLSGGTYARHAAGDRIRTGLALGAVAPTTGALTSIESSIRETPSGQ